MREEVLISPSDLFAIIGSQPHGHVEAVLGLIRKLGIDRLIAAKRSRRRDLIVGMIAEQAGAASLLEAGDDTSGEDHDTGSGAGVGGRRRQRAVSGPGLARAVPAGIKKKLAARHLGEGDLALYDVSSRYFEGRTCVLAAFVHDRDRRGLPILVYGVMTVWEGRSVAVQVNPGRMGDPRTVADQVEKCAPASDSKRSCWWGTAAC